jgi:hypothetical protein
MGGKGTSAGIRRLFGAKTLPQMVKTQAIHVERERALEELGITVDKNVRSVFLSRIVLNPL